ncbi:MAG: sialate O-acetylesterase, partial [Akkermansiaceae bacterium]
MNINYHLSAALFFAATFSSSADVIVSKAFGDHMVLQQGAPIRVWGTGDPGESVSVSLGGKTAKATTTKEGSWRVDLPSLTADGKSLTMTVKGKNTIEIKDVLLGEVWICSGQSNMEWAVNRSLNPKEEIAAAKHPQIRLFNVPGHVAQPEPGNDPRGKWQICSPESVPSFSAVGYYFGRELQKELNIPIGLVGTNWGGTRIEPWTPPVGFKSVPNLK